MQYIVTESRGQEESPDGKLHTETVLPQVLKERWGFVNLRSGSREEMGRLQERPRRVEAERLTVCGEGADKQCWLLSLAETNKRGQGEKGDRTMTLTCQAQKHSLFHRNGEPLKAWELTNSLYLQNMRSRLSQLL